MKRLLPLLLGFFAATSPAQQHPAIPAPDFRNVTRWINSEPLHIADLRGKVVLVDFWTYGCSNCLATLPHLKRWYADYASRGLVIVGVHSPEFDSEKDPRAVRTQVKRLGIEYPVAQDNDLANWQHWAVKVWPTSYLVDRSGNIVLRHVGEGRYEEMEAKIRALLEQPSS